MKHIPSAQLDALAQPIPFHHLIPLANLDQCIEVEHIATPDQLEQALKRRVLARLHRGELCMIPAWQASAYGMPMINIDHVLRRFDDDREEALSCHAMP